MHSRILVGQEKQGKQMMWCTGDNGDVADNALVEGVESRDSE